MRDCYINMQQPLTCKVNRDLFISKSLDFRIEAVEGLNVKDIVIGEILIRSKTLEVKLTHLHVNHLID